MSKCTAPPAVTSRWQPQHGPLVPGRAVGSQTAARHVRLEQGRCPAVPPAFHQRLACVARGWLTSIRSSGSAMVPSKCSSALTPDSSSCTSRRARTAAAGAPWPQGVSALWRLARQHAGGRMHQHNALRHLLESVSRTNPACWQLHLLSFSPPALVCVDRKGN